MKLAMVRNKGRLGVAAANGSGRFHVRYADEPGYPGDLDVLVRGGELIEVGRSLLRAPETDGADLDMLPPLRASQKIICVGLNYASHAAEAGMKVPEHPTIFARFTSSLVGHGQPILRPTKSSQLDYEAEFVAIIGKGGRDIPKETALDHVIGYSLFNDGSVRDYQLRTPQWTVGKNFDGTGAFGPYIMTADELPRGCAGLRLQCRLNGRTLQDASTSDLIFDVATLIAELSEAFALAPGDMIVTGTPDGVGLSHKPPIFMKAGDVCEVELEGFGVLRNPIADQGALS
jgi:2-keto-4-pentenoate hydratase/2-oxohepta-3-ene-1,7-dioic acid hydratase in catechol pathway